jgi:hypothetical protein
MMSELGVQLSALIQSEFDALAGRNFAISALFESADR